MAKHRKAECRLGDEDIAWHDLEWFAGRIGRILVIARCDDSSRAVIDRDLRRAQHMACRMKGHIDIAEPDRLAIGDRLRAAGEILAVAQTHDVQCLLRRQHSAMARAGMIGMTVGDQRPLNRPHRIDMKAAGLAAEAGGHRHQDVLRAHLRYHSCYISTP